MTVAAVCMLASHGELIQRNFFYNSLDTGIDFFHSIEYVQGRMPYGLFDTLYPLLVNVFFYLLYLLVPKDVSDKWASTFEDSLLCGVLPTIYALTRQPCCCSYCSLFLQVTPCM